MLTLYYRLYCHNRPVDISTLDIDHRVQDLSCGHDVIFAYRLAQRFSVWDTNSRNHLSRTIYHSFEQYLFILRFSYHNLLLFTQHSPYGSPNASRSVMPEDGAFAPISDDVRRHGAGPFAHVDDRKHNVRRELRVALDSEDVDVGGARERSVGRSRVRRRRVRKDKTLDGRAGCRAK